MEDHENEWKIEWKEKNMERDGTKGPTELLDPKFPVAARHMTNCP